MLTQRAGSGYDDVREKRYHFPDKYLGTVRKGLGDFFVYYEPRRQGGRSAYVGWGRASGIEPDVNRPGHHYLHVADYQDFPSVVPVRDGHETAVFKSDG